MLSISGGMYSLQNLLPSRTCDVLVCTCWRWSIPTTRACFESRELGWLCRLRGGLAALAA